MTNSFQKILPQTLAINAMAMQEFKTMVATLIAQHIRVIVLPNRKNFLTPDAVFPNNWFSTHSIGAKKTRLILYPMLTENRRLERQFSKIQAELKKYDIAISEIVDFTSYEKQNIALEGTGSLVLDRINKIAYVSLSMRTQPQILKLFAEKEGYKTIVFHSDADGQPIYHTNVMLSIGKKFSVIAAETIRDLNERKIVLDALQKSGREILQITSKQMRAMAANILEVRSREGSSKIILSQTAYHAFTPDQRIMLQKYGELVPINLKTIETIGGGSARCMLGEIFY